jgi:hypothetical protein
MYAVFEEKLKTDKGKSLVSAYENTRDAQAIYKELTKHAKSSTAARLSGETLLKYITSARYPGNWRKTSYAFVLHWKEQVMHYEKLELENVPPNQKLLMLQNTVGDIADLANVKQLSDQVVASGGANLGFKEYLEFLLSACSSYDKTHATPRSGQRNVYTTNVEHDDNFFDAQDAYTYGVDTDVTDILAHATDMRFKGSASSNRNDKSPFVPREDWLKLTPEKREDILAKRRAERSSQAGGSLRPNIPARRVNIHDTQEVVNLDDIIEYTANTHVSMESSGDGEELYAPYTLLAHMPGQTSSGESAQAAICHVMAAKQGNGCRKGRSVKVNEASTTPDTLTIADTTYYLNKGETITFQGHQYFTHSTLIQYCVGQHECASRNMALIDRGANGCICGDDMLVLEGSERFVDVSGLGGHCKNCYCTSSH